MTNTPEKDLQKDPEAVEKASRRRFTAQYKRQIALEAERCSQPGEIGALLRRQGLPQTLISRLHDTRDTRSHRGTRITTLRSIQQQHGPI